MGRSRAFLSMQKRKRNSIASRRENRSIAMARRSLDQHCRLAGRNSCRLQRRARPTGSTTKTPVLFQLAEEKHLAELVGEILRLGNDRQGFRWLATRRRETGTCCSVVGPPYYSLLRAIDSAGVTRHAFRLAYREAQPGVWVQLGYQHPLEEAYGPPCATGKLLLMRPSRLWTFIDEAPFRDIYEVLEFTAPEPAIAWHEADLPGRWNVPLRLTKGKHDGTGRAVGAARRKHRTSG